MINMKDSGVEWIGRIPKGWKVLPIKSGFLYQKLVAGDSHEKYPRLTLAKAGVLERPKYDGNGQSPANYSTYQIVPEGELVFNLMGLEQDSDYRRVGIPPKDGLLSSGYVRLDHNPDVVFNRFALYYFLDLEARRIFNSYGTGIRSTLNGSQLVKIPMIFPQISEQQRIADFLDRKTAIIDGIITDTKQTIEELKSYKQSLISEIVTKGINKDVKLVPSGIEWIGEVPEEWEVLKSRYFLNEISVKGYPDEEVLSLYRDYGIIPKNSRSDNHNVTSSDTSGYKLVKSGNLVINKMKAWQGSMAISNLRGIVSPAYYTFEVDNERFNLRFLHYALRNPAYKQEYMRISAGLRVGQWDLNKNEFKNLKYAFPANKEEQKAIADYLDEKISQIDTLITEKENVISEYENYKKSMIYEYVTGKKQVEGYES